MLILDTDHFSELLRATPVGIKLADRLDQATEDVVLTIITAEEGARGWLAQISRSRSPQQRQLAYDQFGISLEALAGWEILPWASSAESAFDGLRGSSIRVGTMDLRLAAIALANTATLITRNSKDFARVPGLRMLCWI